MRLINTETLRIEEFSDENLPKYAILSHTWGSDETSYYDFFARWFTRGWALQELLACAKATFFDRHWKRIADRDALVTELSVITLIPTLYLQDRTAIRNASIAMRMSWASRRATTRVEDMAYCLLGLFDISMPLIYGEGQRAFMRLQLELLKKPQDDTIFAWKKRGTESSGMLASWPDAFASSGNVVHSKLADKHELGFPYSMTNLGLEMQIPLDTGQARQPPAKKRKTAIEQPMMKRQMAVNKKRKVAVGSSAEDQVNLPNQQALVMNRGTENAVDIMLDCGMIKTLEALETGAHDEAWQNRVVIRLKRFGSTWRRVKCDKIETVRTELTSPTEPVVPSGYTVYYIEQPGL
ncbi:Vegetative incompatibility protein HET-E-1, partial [Pseudocercospora fuligena]